MENRKSRTELKQNENISIKMKNLKYWAITIIITYGVLELFSFGGLFFIKRYSHLIYEPADTLFDHQVEVLTKMINNKTKYTTFSPTLGWTIKENGESELYQANSAGIRGNNEYPFDQSPGSFRISTFGDSFTHGDDVKNDETWQAYMEDSNPDMEVLNFGVGGYGLDQAYLRYKEKGRHYGNNVVLIGFMSENISRNVNTFRPFYYSRTGVPLAKPRFEIIDDQLTLVPNVIQDPMEYESLFHSKSAFSRLGVKDFYYPSRYNTGVFDFSPTYRLLKIIVNRAKTKLHDKIFVNGIYNEDADAYKITTKLFDAFYSDVLEDKSIPIIVIFPHKDDLMVYQETRRQSYEPLLLYLDASGYQYIDLMDIFKNGNVDDLFADHYTPYGNQLVANTILEFLETNKLFNE